MSFHRPVSARSFARRWLQAPRSPPSTFGRPSAAAGDEVHLIEGIDIHGALATGAEDLLRGRENSAIGAETLEGKGERHIFPGRTLVQDVEPCFRKKQAHV